MKKRFILSATGQPVDIGDVIRTEKTSIKKNKKTTKITLESLAESNIEKYLSNGVIKEVNKEYLPKHLDPTSIYYYIGKILKKLDIDKVPEDANLKLLLIAKLFATYEFAFKRILIREIAEELDSKYEGTIATSPEIWIIDLFTMKPVHIDKKYIKSYRDFSAFRTEEDAKFALNVMKGFKEWPIRK